MNYWNMSINTKKRRYPTTSSPHESDDDNGGLDRYWYLFFLFVWILDNLEQTSNPANPIANKRRGSVAADFAPPRLIVSERQQMAVLKQLTAGDESNSMFFLSVVMFLILVY
jgi:hypothetical protein